MDIYLNHECKASALFKKEREKKSEMSNVDDLISELFPGKSARAAPAQSPLFEANAPPVGKASEGSWDEPTPKRAAAEALQPTPRSAIGKKEDFSEGAPIAPVANNSFEESDEDERGVPQHHHHAVPFPSAPNNLAMRCTHSCTVSTLHAGEREAHPTLTGLRDLASRPVPSDPGARHLLMKLRGAFHVCSPSLGNGVDPSVGCPFIACKRCDHGVVRLQGARWNDDGGRRDLYLVVRNFYPDWSRVAVAEVNSICGPVLV